MIRCDCCVDEIHGKIISTYDTQTASITENYTAEEAFGIISIMMKNTEKAMKNELIIREKIKDRSVKDIGTKNG